MQRDLDSMYDVNYVMNIIRCRCLCCVIKIICFCSLNCNSTRVFYLTVFINTCLYGLFGHMCLALVTVKTIQRISDEPKRKVSEHSWRKKKALSLTPCWESWKPPSGFYLERKINVNNSNLNRDHLQPSSDHGKVDILRA